jgi:hypothetical protein
VLCASEDARFIEAVSLREDVVTMKEYIALTGWHRISG